MTKALHVDASPRFGARPAMTCAYEIGEPVQTGRTDDRKRPKRCGPARLKRCEFEGNGRRQNNPTYGGQPHPNGKLNQFQPELLMKGLTENWPNRLWNPNCRFFHRQTERLFHPRHKLRPQAQMTASIMSSYALRTIPDASADGSTSASATPAISKSRRSTIWRHCERREPRLSAIYQILANNFAS